MKALVAAAIITLAGAFSGLAQKPIAIGQFVTLNSATGTPVALTNAYILATKITFIGNKDNRTANTGTVWIGSLSADNTQPIPIASGTSVSVSIPQGSALNLSQLYLDVATANDGVLVVYE